MWTCQRCVFEYNLPVDETKDHHLGECEICRCHPERKSISESVEVFWEYALDRQSSCELRLQHLDYQDQIVTWLKEHPLRSHYEICSDLTHVRCTDCGHIFNASTESMALILWTKITVLCPRCLNGWISCWQLPRGVRRIRKEA